MHGHNFHCSLLLNSADGDQSAHAVSEVKRNEMCKGGVFTFCDELKLLLNQQQLYCVQHLSVLNFSISNIVLNNSVSSV